MVRPSIEALPAELARVAKEACRRIASAGARGWVVGGAVRDLGIREHPYDVDLSSALEPQALEALFATSVPVGRAFGTVVLVLEGQELQHTTFRSERDYADARRPEHVVFGETLEEDARRRDFTCNALYLDPLTDELADPEGGRADLEAGLLRCVGDPDARFAEDGLRILRLARFAAGYGFAVEPATQRAAAANLEALRGVSPERVAGELARLTARPGAARALGLLEELGVLELFLTRFGTPAPAAERARRLAVLERLPEPVAFPELLATLWLGADRKGLQGGLEALRLSRRDQRTVTALLDDVGEAHRLLAREAQGVVSRAGRLRLVRTPLWPSVLRLLAAEEAGATAEHGRDPGVLARFRRELDPEELFPEALLASADLAAARVPRGPRWGALLREAEELQLEGELATREQALAWLARRAAEGGG